MSRYSGSLKSSSSAPLGIIQEAPAFNGVSVICVDFGSQALCEVDGVSRYKLIAALLGQKHERKYVRFRSSEAERTLLHAVRQETNLSKSLPIAAEPTEDRQAPFSKRQTPERE